MAREQLPGPGVTALPPPAMVHAALRATTERLAAEVAQPRHSPPDWSQFQWRTARAAAAMLGVSGVLASGLRWRGPPGWADFLSEQRQQIATRHVRLQALLGEVGTRFAAAGIPVQALKGAALCGAGIYSPGERPMADLDLLVAAAHTARASAVLEGLGLRESHRTVKHRVFVAWPPRPATGFGEHAANDLKVELHERICEALPLQLTEISDLILPRAATPGLNPYPSCAALLAHLLLHAAADMAIRGLRMIQLHDIALLARRLTAQDWQELAAWAPWWAWPPLSLTVRYYGALAPAPLMTTLRERCPARLRRACARHGLYEVAMSKLWVEAFPGIEWTRSLAEALTYMRGRLVPDLEVRAQRRRLLESEPSLAGTHWSRLSQRRRMLRFLLARTPRPWPLYHVRAALAQPR
jgi:putative nucleotidyltransferase-like protein